MIGVAMYLQPTTSYGSLIPWAFWFAAAYLSHLTP